jgi:hypothetical protein
MASTDRVAMMAEAYARGILPPDVKARYEEAINRGLVTPPAQTAAPEAPQPEKGVLRTALETVHGYVGGATDAATQGLTFGFADEIGAGIRAGARGVGNAITGAARAVAPETTEALIGPQTEVERETIGQSYDRALTDERQRQKKFAEAYPVTDTVANIAGGLAVGAPGAAPVAGALVGRGVATAAGAAPGALTSLAKAGTIGAVSGGVSGFGAGEGGFQNRLDSAGEGALWGGALGVGIPLAIKGVGATFRKGVQEPGFTPEGRERAVANDLRRNATDPEALVGKIDAGSTELIPGSKPTLYQATGDSGIANLERGVSTRNPVPFQDLRAQQNAARHNAVEGLAPTDAQPGLVSQKIETQLRGISDDFDSRIAAAVSERDQAVSGMGGAGERAAYGEQFRATLKEAKKAEKEQVDALYARIDPDDTLALDIGGVKQAATEIRSKLPKAAKMAQEEARLHEVLDSLPDVEKFTEIRALRSELLDAIRNERVSNGETQALRRMTQLQASIERTIGAAAEAPAARPKVSDVGRNTSPLADDGLTPNFGPEDAARYRMASAAHREMSEKFKGGPVGKVLHAGKNAEFGVVDSEVAGKLFNGGGRSKEDVEAFAAAVGDRKVAARQLYDYAASDLRSKAMKDDGSLDPTKWRNWMDKHFYSLKTLDKLSGSMELRGRFMKASEAQRIVDELGAGKAQSVADFGGSAARHFLNRENPVAAVGTALDEPFPVRAMQELRAMVGTDKEALDGLRRGVLEHLKMKFVGTAEAGDTGLNFWSSDGFQKYIRQHQKALAVVFTPDQFKVLNAMAADLRRANRSIVGGKLPGGSNTAQDAIAATRGGRMGSMLEHLTAAGVGGAAGAAVGGPVGGAVGAAVGAVAAKGVVGLYRKLGPGKINALLEEAVLDPALARALLTKYPANKIPQELITWLENRLAGGLISGIEGATDDRKQASR